MNRNRASHITILKSDKREFYGILFSQDSLFCFYREGRSLLGSFIYVRKRNKSIKFAGIFKKDLTFPY